ncbi:lipocalin family protein [Tenacibaculum sp.]|uniref:lipocalin family protein n=1 Tax=Tenacibaculum sp. TaxID=1906242 RepID=UPI003D1223EF
MKKVSLFLITFILILTSCSSDDNKENISADIVGTWIGNSIDYSGKTETTVQGQTLVTDFVGEGYDMDYTLTFNETPNIITSEGSYSLKLTYSVLGQTSVQNLENLKFLEEGTWILDGNKLDVTANGVSKDYEIIELTETTLKISLSTEEDLSESGSTIITTIDAIVTFTRS